MTNTFLTAACLAFAVAMLPLEAGATASLYNSEADFAAATADFGLTTITFDEADDGWRTLPASRQPLTVRETKFAAGRADGFLYLTGAGDRHRAYGLDGALAVADAAGPQQLVITLPTAATALSIRVAGLGGGAAPRVLSLILSNGETFEVTLERAAPGANFVGLVSETAFSSVVLTLDDAAGVIVVDDVTFNHVVPDVALGLALLSDPQEPVSEPGAVALLGAALLTLGRLRSRRRRTA